MEEKDISKSFVNEDSSSMLTQSRLQSIKNLCIGTDKKELSPAQKKVLNVFKKAKERGLTAEKVTAKSGTGTRSYCDILIGSLILKGLVYRRKEKTKSTNKWRDSNGKIIGKTIVTSNYLYYLRDEELNPKSKEIEFNTPIWWNKI